MKPTLLELRENPSPAQLMELCYILDSSFDGKDNAPELETHEIAWMAKTIWRMADRLVPLHPEKRTLENSPESKPWPSFKEPLYTFEYMPEADRRELVFTIAKHAARTGGGRGSFDNATEFLDDALAALGYLPEENFQSSIPWKQETAEILFQAFDNRPAKRQDAITERAEKNRGDMARMIEEQLESGSMEEERAEFLRAQLDAPRAVSFAIEEFRAVIAADISAKRSKAAKSRKKV